MRLDSGRYVLKGACYFLNTMPHHENLRLLQTDHRNYLLPIFITWIDADFKCLSTAFYFVLFDSELVKILIFFEFSELFELFLFFYSQNSAGQEFPKTLYHCSFCFRLLILSFPLMALIQ